MAEEKKMSGWRLLLAGAVPVVLLIVFQLLKDSRAAMNAWVFGVLEPVEQFWSLLWSVLPLSGLELLIAGVIVFHVVWIVRTLVLAVREKDWKRLLRRVLVLAVLWLWLWAALCWLWNAAYGADGFSARSGLTAEPLSVEELYTVTEYFAAKASQYAEQVQRDGDGHFAEDLAECFARGKSLYENLEQVFPCLEGPERRAKPLICSRLQSILGFTGVYSPFTGEANVNVDAPACLVPATIGHEMAHQRMISSETEANFVGIAACITSEDPVFQYSGYLMGLMQFSGALYSADPDAWFYLTGRYFTPGMHQDWTDNNEYWSALESPVEETATQVYDSYLKDNKQELGIKSYGACVDLLVAFLLPQAQAEGYGTYPPPVSADS